MNKMHLTTLFAAAAYLAATLCAAAEYSMPQLPDGVMPNTEVSTNLPLHVSAERLREFALTLNASNCASNEVLVAIGCDADGNGELSFEETAFVFGCDCGERYLVDYDFRHSGRHCRRNGYRRLAKFRSGMEHGEAASTLSTNMWDHADAKVRRLWPNQVPTDNHAVFSSSFDFNYNFCSPGVVEGRIR